MSRYSSKQGFTLVEMMVVITIFIITTGIVLANLPVFRDKTSLDAIAQEVSVVIRQAQVYGMSTKNVAGSETFPSHGVYFPWMATGPALLEFFMFADIVPSSAPDEYFSDGNSCAMSGSECEERYRFSGGVYISNVRVCGSSGCEDLNYSNNKGLSVTFVRPVLEPQFYLHGAGGDITPENYNQVILTLVNKQGQSRLVNIWNTGHIYVEPV